MTRPVMPRAGPENDAGAISSSSAPRVHSALRTTTDGSEGAGEIKPIVQGGASHRRFMKMNRPLPPFVWFTREMLESPAWAAMTLAARRIVERVMIEHMMHGGTSNGRLIVTYDDFVRYGMRRKSIAKAIRTAVALGFLDVTNQGGRTYGIARRPSTYGLTWLPRCDWTPPSNRWKFISKDDAMRIVFSPGAIAPLCRGRKRP